MTTCNTGMSSTASSTPLLDGVAPASPRKRILRRVPSTPPRRPEITVVIPSYNYARYLRDCVASVLAQPHVEVRVVIIDDCSTDDTPEVSAALTAMDRRVRVIRHSRNKGHIPTVNEGLEHVDTEYIVKLDADDLLAPGALARATALLERYPSVGFVYGRPDHFTDVVPTGRADARTRSWTIWSGEHWMARRCLAGDNAISQPEVVIRTSMLRRVGGVREDLPHTSDLYQWMQLASMGDVGRVNGPTQGYYRVHANSMQRTVHSGPLFGLRARRAAFDAIFAGPVGDLSNAEALRDRARRTLAAEALDRACHEFDRGRGGRPEEPIEEFIAFALETWPSARDLPEWASLARRQSVGARWAGRHPGFVAAAVRRRTEAGVKHWVWRRTGEL